MINKIIQGHDLDILPKLSAESVSCVTCSPPYWGLRDYGVEPVIWDGDKNCKHIWGNKTITLKHKSGETNPGKEGWFKNRGVSDDKVNCFCLKCGAWKGSLGLEPTFDDKIIEIEIVELKSNLTESEKKYVLEELKKCNIL